MRIRVNGEDREFDSSALSDIIGLMHLDPQRVAAELNGDIVRRADFGTTELKDGDVLELVGFVGGG